MTTVDCLCFGVLYIEYTDRSAMSFFNLTHTGVQDPFKTASYSKGDQSNLSNTSTAEEDGGTYPQSQPTQASTSPCPSPSPQSTLTPTHVQTMYSSSETGESGRAWHGGSHRLYTERLQKHQRHPQGPMQLYQHPMTTSNEYGWWMKDGSPHKEEWAQSETHVHVNSEMTRFVDDMSLTNKEFSLY